MTDVRALFVAQEQVGWAKLPSMLCLCASRHVPEVERACMNGMTDYLADTNGTRLLHRPATALAAIACGHHQQKNH